jgi:hypothetical protein
MKTFSQVFSIALLTLVSAATSVRAVVIMDQIGPDPSFVQSQPAYASQQFEPSFSQFTIGALDDFVNTAATPTLDRVDAALLGFGGFVTYNNVTAWRVEIYSTPQMAALNLTGDIGSQTVAPGGVTLTTPYTTDSVSALVSIPVSIAVGAGTFYVAVIPVMNFTGDGQIGVSNGTFVGFPRGENAYQANPGGGFGFTLQQISPPTDLAYRIDAVPEPPPWAMMTMGAVVLVGVQRLVQRKRAKA